MERLQDTATTEVKVFDLESQMYLNSSTEVVEYMPLIPYTDLREVDKGYDF